MKLNKKKHITHLPAIGNVYTGYDHLPNSVIGVYDIQVLLHPALPALSEAGHLDTSLHYAKVVRSYRDTPEISEMKAMLEQTLGFGVDSLMYCIDTDTMENGPMFVRFETGFAMLVGFKNKNDALRAHLML